MQKEEPVITKEMLSHLVRAIVFAGLLYLYLWLLDEYGFERVLISLLLLIMLNTGEILKAVSENAGRNTK